MKKACEGEISEEEAPKEEVDSDSDLDGAIGFAKAASSAPKRRKTGKGPEEAAPRGRGSLGTSARFPQLWQRTSKLLRLAWPL